MPSSFYVVGDEKIRAYIGKAPSEPGRYNYMCNACGFVDKCHGNLRVHVESKHYSPGYNCRYCGREFKIRASYKRHEKGCSVVYVVRDQKVVRK